MAGVKRPRGFDRSSDTYNQAKSIIGGSGSGSASTTNGSINLPKPHEIKRIEIEPAENGGSVIKHELKEKPGKKGEDTYIPYDQRSHSHAFTDAASAHAHLGKLMGCDDCH